MFKLSRWVYGLRSFVILVLFPLVGCAAPSYQTNYGGSIKFDSGINEPFVVQVYNNDLGTRKTDNKIVVEITADRTLVTPGDAFRTLILSGSNVSCTASDYIRGKLNDQRTGMCDFPNGQFEEVVNGKKTGRTIKVEFDQTVRDGEREQLNAAVKRFR